MARAEFCRSAGEHFVPISVTCDALDGVLGRREEEEAHCHTDPHSSRLPPGGTTKELQRPAPEAFPADGSADKSAAPPCLLSGRVCATANLTTSRPACSTLCATLFVTLNTCTV